jgi:predicted regulator of Ras-like GTPase activity (Roadblock/LC7/MglB family)
MSSFGDILQRMVMRVPGALGAVFSDWEGEAVDQFAHVSPAEIQLVGAHWGVVLNMAAERVQRAGGGAIDELWIEAEHGLVLVRRVNAQYYVVLAVGRESHLAIARRELESSVQSLLGEM